MDPTENARVVRANMNAMKEGIRRQTTPEAYPNKMFYTRDDKDMPKNLPPNPTIRGRNLTIYMMINNRRNSSTRRFGSPDLMIIGTRINNSYS